MGLSEAHCWAFPRTVGWPLMALECTGKDVGVTSGVLEKQADTRW